MIITVGNLLAVVRADAQPDLIVVMQQNIRMMILAFS